MPRERSADFALPLPVEQLVAASTRNRILAQAICLRTGELRQSAHHARRYIGRRLVRGLGIAQFAQPVELFAGESAVHGHGSSQPLCQAIESSTDQRVGALPGRGERANLSPYSDSPGAGTVRALIWQQFGCRASATSFALEEMATKLLKF